MSQNDDFLFRNRALFRYVGPKEKIVFASHRHWACLWEPIVTTTLSFVLVVAVTIQVEQLAWLWVPWFLAAGRLAWRYLEWRAEWFVVTNLQIRLIGGIVGSRVSTMATKSVTDFQFTRRPLGMLLGYGSFRFESPGQDQALTLVDYVPDPDRRYQLLVATFWPPAAAPKPPDPQVVYLVNSGQQPPSDHPGSEHTTQPIPTLPPIVADQAPGAGLPGGPTTAWSDTQPPRPYL